MRLRCHGKALGNEARRDRGVQLNELILNEKIQKKELTLTRNDVEYALLETASQQRLC